MKAWARHLPVLTACALALAAVPHPARADQDDGKPPAQPDAKPPDAKQPDTKQPDAKQPDTKPPEKPGEPKPPDAKPADKRPSADADYTSNPDAPKDPIDVTVQGQREAPSVSTLTRNEVRQLPGAFGDPFRAIEILPGVTPIVSGLPFFYVRGAPPGNVGYFLDGVRVPYLFHVAAGPSVIHPAMIDHVDLHAGGYPAEYGGYAGAIVSAETTEPRPDLHGEANIRLVDAGILAEAGFDKDANGTPRASVLLGGRFSYTAALFSLVSPDVTLDYRDYQARFTYDITPRDRISLVSFGAYDFLSNTTDGVESVLFGAEFYRVDARYDAKLPNDGHLRAAATFGYDRTRIVDGRNTRDVSLGSRLTIKQPVSRAVTLRGGFVAQNDNYTAEPRPYVDPDDPDQKAYDALFPPRSDSNLGAWADAVIDIGDNFHITPGVRVDTFFSDNAHATGVDPRLEVTADVGDRVRILHAIGIAHQPPSFVVPVPGLAVANLTGGLQTAIQASGGVEVQLPESITATATVFDSVFVDMTDALSVNPNADSFNQIPRSLGGAKGLEIYLRKSLSSRIGGFISYTFSRSTRTVADPIHGGSITIPAAFDRTHVLHSAVAFDLGHGWRLGTRFSLYTGSPVFTPPAGTTPTTFPTDPPRDPPFYRIDFRLEKRWRVFQKGWLSFVAEMVNTTLNTETIQGAEVGPVSIPSIGVEGGL